MVQDKRRTALTGTALFAGISGFSSLLLLLFRALLFRNPDLARAYSASLYPSLASVWGWPAKLLPFSLTEFFALAGSFLFLLFLVLGLIRLIRNRDHRMRRFLRSFLLLLGIALTALSLFMVFHGLNYARPPLSADMGLEVRARPLEDLEAAARLLARQASALREELAEDPSGLSRGLSMKEIQESAYEGWDRLVLEEPVFESRVRVKPKGVLLSPYWSYTRIVGLYMPLLVEPNINTDQPAFMWPATAAHELAHARGIAREDECDFTGILSCLYHPDPVWRYSGLISAFKSMGSRLAEEDPDLWYALYKEDLSPAVKRDLDYERSYWKKFETPVAKVSQQINDAYLKSNKVDEGVKNYGAVVDLLLAWLDSDRAPGELTRDGIGIE